MARPGKGAPVVQAGDIKFEHLALFALKLCYDALID